MVAGDGTSFTVTSGASVQLVAGQCITIMPDTRFDTGSTVRAYIDQTGTYCNSTKGIYAQNSGTTLMPSPSCCSDDFIRVYPNPTGGSFTLEVTDPNTLNIMVYGIYGDLVLETTVWGQYKYDLSLALQPPGIYILRVISGNEIRTAKIVRQ
jgi:hypothetical protein